MSGNSIGQRFKVTTAGESHGPSVACIIDGCPPGLNLDPIDFVPDLQRRKTGLSKFTSQRKEEDAVQILSGVFNGKTTGTPILLHIQNQDPKPHHYEELKTVFRPGHGDYTYFKKYGIRDYRGGGRSSARETVARVAAGVIARKWLQENTPIRVRGYLAQMGPIKIDKENFDWEEIEKNPFFCPDSQAVPLMISFIDTLRKEGNSIGAKVVVKATGVPIGLGEPVFDRLDADVAKAMMSIPAVKGVEIGAGFNVVEQKGSENRDPLTQQGFMSNHAGGILGGISSGQDIDVGIALKPASSILLPIQTLDENGEECTVSTKGRHDPCVGIRAVPVAESMMLLVLMDHYLRYCNTK